MCLLNCNYEQKTEKKKKNLTKRKFTQISTSFPKSTFSAGIPVWAPKKMNPKKSSSTLPKRVFLSNR